MLSLRELTWKLKEGLSDLNRRSWLSSKKIRKKSVTFINDAKILFTKILKIFLKVIYNIGDI